MMRKFVRNILLVVILTKGFVLFGQGERLGSPNIIIIISDDHTRQAISAYGSTIALTPNIDRIAENGFVFNNAYINNSFVDLQGLVYLLGNTVIRMDIKTMKIQVMIRIKISL